MRASSSAIERGAAADKALTLAAQEQLEWMRKNAIRHGRPSKHSKTLAQRIEDEDFEQHGGKRPMESDHHLGDRLGFLLTLVLQYLRDGGYLLRCTGEVPRAAQDPRRLHGRLYTHWLTNYANWDTLTEATQRCHLRAILFKMWNTDKKREVMRPEEEQRRRLCEASWNKFWLSDDELDDLVISVISTYRAEAQFV